MVHLFTILHIYVIHTSIIYYQVKKTTTKNIWLKFASIGRMQKDDYTDMFQVFSVSNKLGTREIYLNNKSETKYTIGNRGGETLFSKKVSN